MPQLTASPNITVIRDLAELNPHTHDVFEAEQQERSEAQSRQRCKPRRHIHRLDST
jgi:hypothetical protein